MSKELEKAYRALYNLVGASEEDHFVFTSSGAEAVNHVIFASYLDITRKMGKNHFVTSTLGEAPQILAMSRLQELGCLFQMVECNSVGKITVEALSETVTPRTALVSLSTACGLTGLLQTELMQIGRLCNERGILFHVDVTHTLGKTHFSWDEVGADVLTFHGEGFQGPMGTGGLFFREEGDMSPLILGGEEQAGMRGGSFSQATLIALGKAAEEASALQDTFSTEVAYLRSHFEEGVVKGLEDVKVLFEEEERVPHLTLLDFGGVHGEGLHYLLKKRGLAVSMGGGHFQRVQMLVRACKKESFGALSFSFSHKTSREEVEKMVQIVIDTVTHLRTYSKGL